MEANVRMQEREARYHILDRGHLGGVALQELEARRHVGEEVAYLDHHARQQRPSSVLDDLACPNPQLRSAARAIDLRDGGDARESLSPKAKRLDDGEVGE